MNDLLSLEPELVTNVRRTTLNGREYVVADVTILKEGVLSGSKGPLFYPFEEIARRPGIWNGVPLTNGHPTDPYGNPISARSPDALNKFGLGQFFSDTIDEGSKTRKGQIWVDVQVANRVLPELIPAIEAKKQIDISTGLFTSDQLADNNATYNGKGYTHIARDHLPDHLAILIKDKGACSVKDGCGINVNATSLPKDTFLDSQDDRILGTTRNCPKCGALMGGTEINCPSCGAKMPSPKLSTVVNVGGNCGVGPGGFQQGNTCASGGGGGGGGDHTKEAATRTKTALEASEKAGAGPVSHAIGLAKKHSEKAQKSKGDQKKDAHLDAAVAHSALEDYYTSKKDKKLSELNKRAADAHRNAAFGRKPTTNSKRSPSINSLTEVSMDRAQLVNWLTTNCECWKGKGEVLQNEKSFTDDDLKKLKANAETSTLAINTLREVGATLELPKNATLDDLKTAVTNTFEKAKSKSDDDDDDDEEGNGKKMKTNKEMVVNALKEIPEKEVLELFPSLKQTVNAASEVVNEKRMEIMRQLTANISDEKEKKNKLLMLKDKTLPQLREFLAFAGTTNAETPKDDNETFLANFFKTGNYSGSQGSDPSQTQNRSTNYDRTAILPPTTLNVFNDEEVA